MTRRSATRSAWLGAVFPAMLMLGLGSVHGQELVATKPGVMCRSADALGKLTLPGGDSRTHAAAPRPEDLAVAASGGCIDIPRGVHVTVQQAFHNTSIVSYGPAGASPFVIPNADFQPLSSIGAAAPSAAAPTGYAVVQRLALTGSDGGTLVLLEDRRLTSKLRDQLWGQGDAEFALDPHDPLVADLHRRPLLNAKLQLLSVDGAVLAETVADRPLAKLDGTSIRGVPTPTVLFTVDESAGMGGFSGPATTLLTPATTRLTPVPFVTDGHGPGGELDLGSTLHTGWRIVPARHGGPDEIESASCPASEHGSVLTLQTYRFRDGQWHMTQRRGGECADIEGLPPRGAFP